MNEKFSQMSLDESIRAGMNIVDGEEYHKAFVGTSHATANVLKKTLGPFGHTTVIDDGQFRYSTKDGWSLVNRLGFGDPLYNTMYSFIKSISYNLVTKVGDGTTTAIVAADAFIRQMESNESLKKYRQRDILRIMNKLTKEIIEVLQSEAYLHPVTNANNWEAVYNIAYTSTNENEELAGMIRDIYAETENPNIYVNVGADAETTATITKGYRLDCAPREISVFANSDTREYQDNRAPLCFFCNHNVTFTEHLELINALNRIGAANKKTVLIFAPYFDEALSSQVHEMTMRCAQQGSVPYVMMVQTPYANSIQRQLFNDAAIVAKATVYTPTALHACEQFWTKHNIDGSEITGQTQLQSLGFETAEDLIWAYCGSVQSLTANQKFVLFREYDDQSNLFKNALAEAKAQYDEEKDNNNKTINPLNQAYMNAQLRYIRLMGKMGTINVGGASEQEKQFLKDTVDDAVLACRSSYEHGYVKGMNLATLGAITDVFTKKYALASDSEPENVMAKTILLAMISCFEDVCYAVMANKYSGDFTKDAKLWTSKNAPYKTLTDTNPVLESANTILAHCYTYNTGYNIVTESYEPNHALTIVNSVNTDIEILRACVSILSYVLTSNQLLSVNRVYDTEARKSIVLQDTYDKYEVIGKAIYDAIVSKIDIPVFPKKGNETLIGGFPSINLANNTSSINETTADVLRGVLSNTSKT